jgi:ankyrin repeat protein
MCKNATRQLTWRNPAKINLLPLFVKENSLSEDTGLSIQLTVNSITTASEYQIFSSLRQGNITQVLDLIEEHIGVNAVDEWGQTPLMISAQMNRMEVIAALLNTRMPKVDINAAKSVV